VYVAHKTEEPGEGDCFVHRVWIFFDSMLVVGECRQDVRRGSGYDLNVIRLAVRFEWHIDEVPGGPSEKKCIRRFTEA
jgi:hypothetical protein